MKTILMTVNLLFLISCASSGHKHVIKESQYDGLKFESLKRFDDLRIQSKKGIIANCHKGNHSDSIEKLKLQLDNRLEQFEYWNEVSTCYILEKNYTRARFFLDIGLSRAKTNTQKSIIYNNYGVTYLENSKFSTAKEYFHKSIETNHKALTPKFNLAQIYIKFGLYSKAEKELHRLLRANSSDVDFIASMGHLKLMQGKHFAAIKIYKGLPNSYKSRDDIATNIAMAYLLMGNFEKSRLTLGQAEKKNKKYVAAQLDIMKKIDSLTRK